MHAEQATSGSAPVINFAERNHTRRRPSQRRLVVPVPDHPDGVLITACIEYAMQIRGAQVTYEIDPTDSDFAEVMDDFAQGKARDLLAIIMANRPTTMDGLRAKAKLTSIVLEDWAGDLDQADKDFLISIAEDVVDLHKACNTAGKSDAAFETAFR